MHAVNISSVCCLFSVCIALLGNGYENGLSRCLSGQQLSVSLIVRTDLKIELGPLYRIDNFKKNIKNFTQLKT